MSSLQRTIKVTVYNLACKVATDSSRRTPIKYIVQNHDRRNQLNSTLKGKQPYLSDLT